MSDSSCQQFSVVRVIIGAVVVGAFIILLLPTIFQGHGNDHPRVYDLSNVRQINVGLTWYVVDYKGHGSGIDMDGILSDPKVENRYSLIMEYIGTSDCLISRYEYDEKMPWSSGPVTSDHYSYAMLQLPESGGRLSLWSDQAGKDVVWISGRNTGSNANSQVDSLQTDDPGSWHGPVGWGDGHVTQEEDQYVDTRYTVGSNTPLYKDDNLFKAVSEDDAYMIYTGN